MAISKSIADLNYETVMAQDIRFDPSDATPDYIGMHPLTDASEDDSGWVIYKFTYSDSNVTRIQKANGVWTNRATYF